MKKIILLILIASVYNFAISQDSKTLNTPDKTVFVFGSDINLKFTQYVIDLTKKENPRVCYLPTASGDNADNIKLWNYFCKKLNIESHILKVWVSANKNNKSFEDILLSMDAIIVGGGNTLNMLGIWKAQGIDTVLNKALNRGIVLAGGSAGSICWFQTGISDSRPVNLSIVKGLSFLPYSNCPHYSQKDRKELYHKEIISGNINPGYASDDRSGILFRNGKFIESVSLNDINNSYYISKKGNKINTTKLKSTILVNKNALKTTEYKAIDIDKPVKDYKVTDKLDSPLNSFVYLNYIFAEGYQSKYKGITCSYLKAKLKDMPDKEVSIIDKEQRYNISINKILIYKNQFSAVINNPHKGYYSIWYFYNENGKWKSAGEDIGGDTLLEAEITFREKAKMIIKKAQNKLTTN